MANAIEVKVNYFPYGETDIRTYTKRINVPDVPKDEAGQPVMSYQQYTDRAFQGTITAFDGKFMALINDDEDEALIVRSDDIVDAKVRIIKTLDTD